MEKRDKTKVIYVALFLAIIYGIVFSGSLFGKSVSEDEYVSVIVSLSTGKSLSSEIKTRGIEEAAWFRGSRRYSGDPHVLQKIENEIIKTAGGKSDK
jgi:hypothetical protein